MSDPQLGSMKPLVLFTAIATAALIVGLSIEAAGQPKIPAPRTLLEEASQDCGGIGDLSSDAHILRLATADQCIMVWLGAPYYVQVRMEQAAAITGRNPETWGVFDAAWDFPTGHTWWRTKQRWSGMLNLTYRIDEGGLGGITVELTEPRPNG